MKGLTHLPARVLPRTVCLLVLTVLGTMALIHSAPGYYSDVRELDASSGALVTRQLQQERLQDAGTLLGTVRWISSALHGNLGISRQFHVPVADLLGERKSVSMRLVALSVTLAWLGACVVAILLSFHKRPALHATFMVPAGWLLALPVGAFSVFCFLTDIGGPVLVMALMLGARELQFLERLLTETLKGPQYLYLQASGMRRARMLRVCVVPQILPQCLGLLMRSVLTALGLLIPVEVVFDLPGLGQLAWSASMNRDAPVLIAITLLFAALLAIFGAATDFSMEAAGA